VATNSCYLSCSKSYNAVQSGNIVTFTPTDATVDGCSCETLAGTASGANASGNTVTTNIPWTATQSGSNVNVNLDVGAQGSCAYVFSQTASSSGIPKIAISVGALAVLFALI